ncbi:hypothetical protein [Nocardioides sp.]|uniref:hypothetical protein n=1 Tax=Nocardioides sp. TaxID=35761 RepID=UPI002D80A1CD|nr:hypothetical protein [Nocardioides sp.]HET8961650.1 hypothetical protein [Nocardioides sp.]
MPTPAASGSPVDLVLHIGMGKTGTTSVQRFMHRNRALLAEAGLLYPRSPVRSRHLRLSLYAQSDDKLPTMPSWRRLGLTSPEKFRRSFPRRLAREIGESGLSRVLLSDEALFGAPDAGLQRIRGLTDRIAASLRLVVYLRRQDDHLVSRYQQVVKTGETRRLAGPTPAAGTADTGWADRQGANTYDYHARLRTWQLLLDPDELVVRRFEPGSFVDGSLYQDFLDAAGVDVCADDLEPVEIANESLDAESVEFLRILNLLRREHEELAALVPGNHPLVLRLAEVCDGPTLTMTSSLLDEFMDRWEESNRRVAREMLGDASGQLFARPRKTRNTTSEQFLDPARLDHFLALLELPEQMHAPLRALAEREAQGR